MPPWITFWFVSGVDLDFHILWASSISIVLRRVSAAKEGVFASCKLLYVLLDAWSEPLVRLRGRIILLFYASQVGSSCLRIFQSALQAARVLASEYFTELIRLRILLRRWRDRL